MNRTHFKTILLLFFIFAMGKILAQDWEFEWEKDGIKIFTRYENGSHYKSFKGETDIYADFSATCALLEDMNKFDQLDDDISEIRFLAMSPGKMLKYYVVYDVPWPFTDRDLCAEAYIIKAQSNGPEVIEARAVPEAVPLYEDRVRIVNYWQRWIIQPEGHGLIHLTLEGFADPAGDIPAWIVNLAITRTPFNVIKAIKDQLK
jgi:hypothetical protein